MAANTREVSQTTSKTAMAKNQLSTMSQRVGDHAASLDAVGTSVDDCLVLIVGTNGIIHEHTSGQAGLLIDEPRKLRGTSIDDIWPADIATRLKSSLRRSVSSRGTYRVELRGGGSAGDTHHEVLILAQGRDRALLIYRDLTESKNLERHVRELAFSDPLTQLPNRAAFLQQLNEAISIARLRGSRIAICRVFLGGFKFINMTFGRTAGNAVVSRSGWLMIAKPPGPKMRGI